MKTFHRILIGIALTGLFDFKWTKWLAIFMVMILFNFGWLLQAPFFHWKTLAQIAYGSIVFMLWDQGSQES